MTDEVSVTGVPAYPRTDEDIPGFLAALGVPGIIDIHVHHLPHRLQEAVWAHFDRLDDPPWPITYRDGEEARLAALRGLGVLRHTALAYPHRAGVAAWCNEHTLDLADQHPEVIPTFTLFAEPEAPAYVEHALGRGGQVAKVHLQVGRFDPNAPVLAPVWRLLAEHRIPVVLHAAAVYGVEGGEQWCGPEPVRRLLDAHPDLTLVVAHLGAPDTFDFLALAADHGDVWFDVSMALTEPSYLQPLAEDVLDAVRSHADRLLFGSDFPSIPHPYAAQVRGLAALGLDAAALRGVLHDRAAALLDSVR